MAILIEILIAVATICAIMIYTSIMAWVRSSIKLVDVADYNKVIDILNKE